MSALRWQHRNDEGGTPALPVILNNNNFAKAAAGEATLLSLDDARTLFHEFGHGLHGLLSDVTYERLSGTQVLRDFVELPSQIFEHWIGEPEVLQRHARHHQTGEPIPDSLVQRLHAARRFNQGYETVRYTASAIVDMAVHSLSDPEPPADLCRFEAEMLEEQGLPHGVGMNHRLVHFQHLFASSGYAAGYYVYLWAEVLDADGYDAFTEAGSPFDAAVAQRLLSTCTPPATASSQVPPTPPSGAVRRLSSRCWRSADCSNQRDRGSRARYSACGANKRSSEAVKALRSSGLVQ
jgi:peptidyl-dipeptidase Dcp